MGLDAAWILHCCGYGIGPAAVDPIQPQPGSFHCTGAALNDSQKKKKKKKKEVKIADFSQGIVYSFIHSLINSFIHSFIHFQEVIRSSQVDISRSSQEMERNEQEISKAQKTDVLGTEMVTTQKYNTFHSFQNCVEILSLFKQLILLSFMF